MSISTYTPAFLEIFLGFVIVALWSRWLNRQPGRPAFVRWVPLGVAAAVVAGQVVGGMAVLGGHASAGIAETVRWARLGSAGAVALGLGLCAAATFLQRTSTRNEPDDPHDQ